MLACNVARRVGKYRNLSSNSIVSCAFICARSNHIVFSLNDASFFKYRIPQLKDEKIDVFSYLENFRRNMRNLLIQTRHNTSGVNTPESGSYKTRGQANWGPYPSTTMIVEADQ